MTKLRIHGFSVSLDGYAAGPGQDLDHPLGVGGTQLHEWVYPTRTFQAMFGSGDGTIGIDDDFAARGFEGIGAWILGRNMFGPPRGPWADDQWKGWWGDNPPYHTPVFVLTHHAQPPIEMAGARHFTSSPTAFTPHCSGRSKPLERWTCGWAAVPRRSGSICKQGWSTPCTWRFRLFCSEAAKVCWRTSIWCGSGIAAASTPVAQPPCMSCSRNPERNHVAPSLADLASVT